MWVVCDMNCNNFGNYFLTIGMERELKEDKFSYIIDNSYFPKKQCYKVQVFNGVGRGSHIKYSEAIDYLLPKDYIRWEKTRFGKVGR